MSDIPLESSQASKWLVLPAACVWRRLVLHLAVFLVVGLGAFFAHEFGHALIAMLLGARVVMFNVLGMQWFPQLQWMPELGFGGYVYWWAPPARSIHSLIVLSGSTFTLVLGLLAAVLLNAFRVAGLGRTALVALSLYSLDSLIKVLPVLGFVPRNWNFRFTRSFSEAYYAALNLGIPSQVYIAAVLLTCFGVLLLLIFAYRSASPVPVRDTIQPRLVGV